jgi:tellurite resistance protein
MSIRTVLAHLPPLARRLKESAALDARDPALLFAAIVEGGYLVAAADGTVDPDELATLKSAVAAISEDELSAGAIDTLVEDLIDLRKSAGEAARCRVVGDVLAGNKAGEEGLYLAAAIAYVSSGLDERELRVMELIADAAHVSRAALATVATSVRDEIQRRTLPGAT